MNLSNFKIGDTVATGNRLHDRYGKCIKIIQPKTIEPGLVDPGGLVLDNETSTFFVPVYDKAIVVMTSQTGSI